MKQQDVAILLVVVFVAGVLTFFVSSKFITPSNSKLTAETVTPITTEFILPDAKNFNDQSINPTVRIEIAPNANPQPFVNETN